MEDASILRANLSDNITFLCKEIVLPVVEEIGIL